MELDSYNNPSNYSQRDLDNYRKIMIESGSLWRDNDRSSSEPKDAFSVKWNKILKEVWDNVDDVQLDSEEDDFYDRDLPSIQEEDEYMPFNLPGEEYPALEIEGFNPRPSESDIEEAERRQRAFQLLEEQERQEQLEERLLTEEIVNTVEKLERDKDGRKTALDYDTRLLGRATRRLKEKLDKAEEENDTDELKEVINASNKLISKEIKPKVKERRDLIYLLSRRTWIEGVSDKIDELREEMATLETFGFIANMRADSAKRLLKPKSKRRISESSVDSGISSASSSKGKGVGTVFLPSDPIALTDRLVLLLQSNAAGNTGVRNEIVSIADTLLKHRFLPMSVYKTIMVNIK